MGETTAGKSSLIRALIAGRPNPTDKADRTQVVDLKLWQVNDGNGYLVYDLGGHPIYAVTSPLFVSEKSSIILAHDISIKAKEADDKTLKVFKRAIHQHPDTDIIIVFTHSDLIDKDELSVRCRLFNDSLEKLLQIKIEALIKLQSPSFPFSNDEISKLIEILQKKRKSIPSFAVSNTSYQGMEDLKEHLVTKLLDRRRALPQLWVNCFKNVCNRDVKFLQKKDFDSCFVQDKSRIIRRVSKFVNKTEIKNCLSYLGAIGLVFHYNDIPKLKHTIFHKPEVLVNLFKVILHHDFVQTLNYDDDKNLRQSFRMINEFNEVRDQFQNEGLLNYKLLSHLWLGYDLDKKDKEVLIAVLKKFNICHEVVPSPESIDKQMLFIPWYVMENTCPDIWEKIEPTSILLNFECLFHGEVPENTNEMLCVSLQRHAIENSYLGKRYAWKDGLLITLGGIECLAYRNLEEPSIQVKVKGKVENLNAMWVSCQELHKSLNVILEQLHGVLKAFHMKCYHCKLRRIEPQHCWPLSQVFPINIEPNVTHEFERCEDDTDNIPSSLIRYFNQDFIKRNADKVVTYLEKVHREAPQEKVVCDRSNKPKEAGELKKNFEESIQLNKKGLQEVEVFHLLDTDSTKVAKETEVKIEEVAKKNDVEDYTAQDLPRETPSRKKPKGLYANPVKSTFSDEDMEYMMMMLSPCVCRINFPGGGGTGFVVGGIRYQVDPLPHRFVLTCQHIKLQDEFINGRDCWAEFGVRKSHQHATNISCRVLISPCEFYSNPDMDYTLVRLEQSLELEGLLEGTGDLGKLRTMSKPIPQEPLVIIGHEIEKQYDISAYSVADEECGGFDQINHKRQTTYPGPIYPLNNRFTLYQSNSFAGTSGAPCFSIKKKRLYAIHCGGVTGPLGTANELEYGVLVWKVILDIEHKIQNQAVVGLEPGRPSWGCLSLGDLRLIFPPKPMQM